MALVHGLKAIQQQAAANKPHIFGFQTARSVANDTLLEIWNAATAAGIKAAIDLDGKFYSAALTAGDLLYAVTGGISNVRRLDSLAIGTANQVLRVNAGATAPEWASTLTLTSLTLSAGSTSPALIVTTTGALNTSLRYDASNRLDIAVGSAGAVTIDAVGASAGFTFSDGVVISATTALQLTSVGDLDGLRMTSTTTTRPTVRMGNASTGELAYLVATNAKGFQVITNAGLTTALDITSAGACTVTGLVTANAGVTVASGQTLTLTGATVAGTPTWSSSQAITVSTAAQPNITSVGSLTSLTIAAGSTTNALIVTTTGAIQQSLRYDGSNRLDIAVSSSGGVTVTAVGAGALVTFANSVTMNATMVIADGQGINWAGGIGAWLGDAASFSVTIPSGGSGQTLITAGSLAARAGFRLPHGTAPSSPTDGDVWTTTAGIFVRVNGSTVGPLS